MESQNSGPWTTSVAAGSPQANVDGHMQNQSRNHGSYSSNHSSQPASSMQIPGPASLPPPSQGPYLSNNQSNNSALPSLGGLTQASPPQPPRPPIQHQPQSPIGVYHTPQSVGPPPQAQQGPGYPLPALSQAMQQNGGDRDRQYQEAEMRELEERQRLHDREVRDQQRLPEQQTSPPNGHSVSVPIQQPVASRVQTTLHGPNGLLNSNVGMGSNVALNGPPNVYANGTPGNDHMSRAYLQAGPNPGPVQQLPAMNGGDPHQIPPGGASALPQGQQPILNDALTYLDQVKVRFQEQPDVYNKFLDIMKDFKSQSIDTPGVIARVSNLFNGHPHLIQGFNTFLPPGYKIEAGWDNDPNSIRVTTPSGSQRLSTMIAQVDRRTNGTFGDNLGLSPRQAQVQNYRPSEAGWNNQRQFDGSEGFSPSMRSVGPPGYDNQPSSRPIGAPQYSLREEEMIPADIAAMNHQQDQRGVSQLQNAANAAAENVPNRMGLAPASSNDAPPGALGQAVAGLNGVSMGMPTGAQGGVEKRGPVEFNHAISYVNKIKNRFASQPEIYKQFLEILQTYQRESKPIQDVYAQVTLLFNSAQDLLEDFKQFLPESAAQAKAQAAARQSDEPMTSNVRGEPSYVSGIPNMSHTPKPDKMPPIGNFAPPSSVSKDNRKRRGGAGSQHTIGAPAPAGPDIGSSRANLQGGAAAKRPKIGVVKPTAPDVSMPSPSLVPELPHPIAPTTTTGGQSEEIAFFDRVKKFVANKSTFNEFLKLCNLFSQDLVDKNTLVHKAEGFIGLNADLTAFFKKMVQYDGQDEVVDNKPILSDSRVVLSNCRALGPSYRLLPKRERFAKCSGRDEMCHQVLNDEWSSHPTWASEDSGFISHKKNQHEEALYRMEEERHDYDFNIETCLRTIQLLEPIVSQINLLTPEERQHYKLPPGLGGASEAIWQRVIKKLYDRSIGQKIIDDMFAKPTKIAPVILLRLKEKAEKWKQAQREWEKVWRDQTHKQFWKSLDHQGLNSRQENKRLFAAKTLQTEIHALQREQKRQKQIKPSMNVPKYQVEHYMTDIEVVLDVCYMILLYIRRSYQGADHARVEQFFKTFIPTFFNLDKEVFAARMADIYSDTPPNEEEEDAMASEETTPRGRRNANGKKTLLRGVLDPKQGKKDQRMDSKESTPDVHSMDEDSANQTDSQSEQPAKVDSSSTRWMDHPLGATGRDRQSVKYNEPFTRHVYSLYANLPIYSFVRMFAMMYERLAYVKRQEAAVQEDVRRALMHKPAIDLKISEKSPAEFWDDVSPTANYYSQILKMWEGFLDHNVESIRIEDTLRRFYMAFGWQLYHLDKTLTIVTKLVSSILNDAKEKNGDILNLFLANRKEEQTTHQIEIDYRKQVEKLAKEGDFYRVDYDESTQHLTFQVFRKEDLTFDTEGMTDDFNWSYYVSSYVMRDWTEGVPRTIRWPLLRRNLPKNLETEEDLGQAYLPAYNSDGLSVRIVPNNYHLLWDIGSTDWWVHQKTVRSRGVKGLAQLNEERKRKFEELFSKNLKWAEGLSEDEMNKRNAEFAKPPTSVTTTTEEVKVKEDVTGDPMATD